MTEKEDELGEEISQHINGKATLLPVTGAELIFLCTLVNCCLHGRVTPVPKDQRRMVRALLDRIEDRILASGTVTHEQLDKFGRLVDSGDVSLPANL